MLQEPTSAGVRPDRIRPFFQSRTFVNAGFCAVVAIILAPLLCLLVISLMPNPEGFSALFQPALPRAVMTTLALVFWTGTVTLLIGVPAAFLVATCSFPGRRFCSLFLVMPLAVPTYLSAYCAVEILGYTGPVQSLLRDIFGFASARDYWFPDMRTFPGAVFVLSIVLYPYVYLSARAAFAMQSGSLENAAKSLGAGPLRIFLTVSAPMARPAIIAGLSLVIMECLNDIGAVEFFGVRTVTFLIYDTWLNRYDLIGAAQIATGLLFFVLILIWLERLLRGKMSFANAARGGHVPSLRPLSGPAAWLAAAFCFLPPLIGFAAPVLILVRFALRRVEPSMAETLTAAAINSIVLASLTALVCLLCALFLTSANRLYTIPGGKTGLRLSSVGYAVPGTILAVGTLIPLASLDNSIDAFLSETFGISTGLLITGSGAALVYACTVRFLTLSTGPLESGYTKISQSLDMAARSLGRRRVAVVGEIHLPLLRPAFAGAAIVTFVDTMKELPVTILLRPFNFETLATIVYAYASLEAFEDAAPGALAIVLFGLVPLFLMNRSQD